jgi:hypothetical protein
MPTFDHPILVQAYRTESGFQLRTKLLDGKGGYEIGKLLTTRQRSISDEEWQRLVDLLNVIHYWSTPTMDPSDEPVADGAVWMIQAKRDGLSHDVLRITPKGRFLDTCRFFLQLADSEQDYTSYLPTDDGR